MLRRTRARWIAAALCVAVIFLEPLEILPFKQAMCRFELPL